MGQTTPNIGIFIPAAGETNYDSSFSSGMVNVDQHDHTGAPTKGVQIATTGLADGSVTYPKLNANVVDTATGLGTEGAPFANRITTTGLLKQLAQMTTQLNGALVTDNLGVPFVLPNSATPGWVLTANAGAPASWQFNSATTKVIHKVFTVPGVNTYTPAADTPNMVYCEVEVVGGGGGSGGSVAKGAGGGGGGGGYAKGIFTAATIGASQTVTIGDGGAGAASGANTGGTGGSTTFGALLTATGGTGGVYGYAPSSGGQGGVGGIGTPGLGSLQVTGSDGDEGFCIVGQNQSFPGFGGASHLGGSVGTYIVVAGTAVGYPGYQYGGGASGGGSQAGDIGGSKGAPGVCIITAYCT